LIPVRPDILQALLHLTSDDLPILALTIACRMNYVMNYYITNVGRLIFALKTT